MNLTKARVLAFVVLGVALISMISISTAPAMAGPCELGPAPAATLLLPYFEVDFENPNGLTTVFSIHNALPDPAVAHVTLWTDYAIPTVNFDIFLTGYDVATVNLRDVFDRGILPLTADAAGDPTDSISPHNFMEEWDGIFPMCAETLPFFDPEGTIQGALLDRIREGHAGRFSAFDNGCVGRDHGDGHARGYVTIDNVNRCNFLFPSDEGYFGDRGTGVASNVNQLWGDYFMVDQPEGFAQGEPLVHIQAFDGVGEDGAWDDGDFTFYSRYLNNSAVDNREPLVTVSANRYFDGGSFEGGTDLLVWRDNRSTDVAAVECSQKPSWFPMYQRRILFFDEEENVAETCGFACLVCSPPAPADACIPLATQRVPITEVARLFPPFTSGWMYMDLSLADEWTNFTELSQSWVVTTLSAAGRYSVGMNSLPLRTACEGEPPLPSFD